MQSFSEMIATPSVSSLDPRFDQSNRPVVETLAEWLESLGFTVELQSVVDKPEKLNLIACAGQGEGGLVFSGHTDTVPYTESAWDQDPFKLIEIDNRLYGLGATDMKCFFPIALEVLKDIDLKKLQYPLYFIATCDEESAMTGAKALVNSKRTLGRYALIGEPTGLKPINKHKGIVMESIKLIGKAGHSSDPALGINALEEMTKVINHLIAWRTDLQEKNSDTTFKVPVPTLNFGSIQGGDNPNRICADCEIAIDIRLLPNMDLEKIRAEVRQTVMQAVDGSGIIVEFDSIFEESGLQTDIDSEIVKVSERLAGEPTGSVAFGTEGPFLNSIGIDTVILGPGDIEQAHQANEYLSMDRIAPMQHILKGMIDHFCMNGD